MTQRFQRILTGHQVTTQVITHLKKWLPTYIAEMERQTGRPAQSLAPIRSWQYQTDGNRWPEQQIPAVLVVSAGTDDEPLPDGRGIYTADFLVGVAVVCSGKGRGKADELASVYAAAIRGVMVQQRSLGGFAKDTRWLGEEWDEIEATKARSLASAQELFVVTVGDVVNAHAGPAQPDPNVDPYAVYPDDPSISTHSDEYNLT